MLSAERSGLLSNMFVSRRIKRSPKGCFPSVIAKNMRQPEGKISSLYDKCCRTFAVAPSHISNISNNSAACQPLEPAAFPAVTEKVSLVASSSCLLRPKSAMIPLASQFGWGMDRGLPLGVTGPDKLHFGQRRVIV